MSTEIDSHDGSNAPDLANMAEARTREFLRNTLDFPDHIIDTLITVDSLTEESLCNWNKAADQLLWSRHGELLNTRMTFLATIKYSNWLDWMQIQDCVYFSVSQFPTIDDMRIAIAESRSKVTKVDAQPSTMSKEATRAARINIPLISPLKGVKDWFVFKREVEAYMTSVGFSKILTCKTTAENEGENNAVVAGILNRAIIDSPSDHVSTTMVNGKEITKDGHAIWNALIHENENDSYLRLCKTQFDAKLLEMSRPENKINGSGDCLKHNNKFRQLINHRMIQLSSGETLTADRIFHAYMSTLGREFNPVKLDAFKCSDKVIALDSLMRDVVEYSRLHKDSGGASSRSQRDAPTASSSSAPKSGNGKGKRNRKKKSRGNQGSPGQPSSSFSTKKPKSNASQTPKRLPFSQSLNDKLTDKQKTAYLAGKLSKLNLKEYLVQYKDVDSTDNGLVSDQDARARKTRRTVQFENSEPSVGEVANTSDDEFGHYSNSESMGL